MKYIITENQKDRLFVLRRINAIDEIIDSSFNQIWKIFKCSHPFEQFFYMVNLDTVDQLEFEIGDSEKTQEVKNFVNEYLETKREEIRDKYHSKCKSIKVK